MDTSFDHMYIYIYKYVCMYVCLYECTYIRPGNDSSSLDLRTSPVASELPPPLTGAGNNVLLSANTSAGLSEFPLHGSGDDGFAGSDLVGSDLIQLVSDIVLRNNVEIDTNSMPKDSALFFRFSLVTLMGTSLGSGLESDWGLSKTIFSSCKIRHGSPHPCNSILRQSWGPLSFWGQDGRRIFQNDQTGSLEQKQIQTSERTILGQSPHHHQKRKYGWHWPCTGASASSQAPHNRKFYTVASGPKMSPRQQDNSI